MSNASTSMSVPNRRAIRGLIKRSNILMKGLSEEEVSRVKDFIVKKSRPLVKLEAEDVTDEMVDEQIASVVGWYEVEASPWIIFCFDSHLFTNYVDDFVDIGTESDASKLKCKVCRDELLGVDAGDHIKYGDCLVIPVVPKFRFAHTREEIAARANKNLNSDILTARKFLDSIPKNVA